MNGRMGRPALGNKSTHVRLDPEDMARIDAKVGDKGRAEFIRKAVKRELERWEREVAEAVARGEPVPPSPVFVTRSKPKDA